MWTHVYSQTSPTLGFDGTDIMRTEEQDLDQCAVCGMKIVDAITSFCGNHSEAYRKINDAYSFWYAAYGRLTTDAFLKRILALPETGDRAREMAQFLSRNPEWWK
jgi:hypothetical protein